MFLLRLILSHKFKFHELHNIIYTTIKTRLDINNKKGGVSLVRILENANRLRKEKVFETYKRTCQNDYFDYDSMTRKEMFEHMIETYTPEYLISICTTWELKALRRLLRNQDLEDDRYRFERTALSSKFLYFDQELPEEFKKNVKLAVKNIDLDQKAENDEPTIVILGIIRAFGIIEPSLIQAVCSACSFHYKSIIESALFNFWAYLKEDYQLIDDSFANEYVYWDYNQILDRIRDSRIQHERFEPKFLDQDSYISIFYHGYDATNSDIKKFFIALKKEVLDVTQFKDEFFNHLLNGTVNEEKMEWIPFFYQFSKPLSNRYHKAVVQIALPNYYGLSMDMYQKMKDQAHFNEKLRQLNEPQTNACIEQKDTRLFYRLYFSILDYVNSFEQIIPNKKIDPNIYIEPDELVNLIEVFWKDKDRFIDEYIEKNPSNFTFRNLNIISDFRYGMRKNFLLVAYEKKYTVLNDEGINYMVKGLNENLDQFIAPEKTPMLMQTAIMPFNGRIIYDGFISTSNIRLAQDIISKAFEDYSYGQKIYSLLPENLN